MEQPEKNIETHLEKLLPHPGSAFYICGKQPCHSKACLFAPAACALLKTNQERKQRGVPSGGSCAGKVPPLSWGMDSCSATNHIVLALPLLKTSLHGQVRLTNFALFQVQAASFDQPCHWTHRHRPTQLPTPPSLRRSLPRSRKAQKLKSSASRAEAHGLQGSHKYQVNPKENQIWFQGKPKGQDHSMWTPDLYLGGSIFRVFHGD